MSEQYWTRGVRGATTAEDNSYQAIEKATIELITEIIKANNIRNDDIASVIFTMTTDLNAEFPAKIARIHFGWDEVPMLCAQEIPVPGSLQKCIRVMLTINTTLSQKEIKHIYQGNAVKLRPDLR